MLSADDPKAGERFERLQKAYEMLCDESAKALYDNRILASKARDKRYEAEGDVRQKMRQVLLPRPFCERKHPLICVRKHPYTRVYLLAGFGKERS